MTWRLRHRVHNKGVAAAFGGGHTFVMDFMNKVLSVPFYVLDILHLLYIIAYIM